MNNFNFNLFKYFYYVVLYNGVTNASKNLSVAQPSLSLSIKKLESELNVTLVDRSNYQFKLTEQGERLFEILKPAFEAIEESINFQDDEKKYSEINIGIRYSYAKCLLSDFLRKFRNKYPKVKINIDLYSELNNDKEYDLVIDDRLYIDHLENVVSESICKLSNYFVCGSTLFEEYADIKSIHEFEIVPLVSYKPSLKMGKFRQLCYSNNVKFLEILSVDESDLYFDLLRENVGIGFSNKLLLKKYLDDKSLHIIEVEEDIFEDELSVAYMENNEIVNSFVKQLKEYINKEMK